VAYRVERTLERREPAREEPSHRTVVRYELESSLQYPGQFLEDRRRDIVQAKAFADFLAPLLPNPGQHGPKPFEAIIKKATAHLESNPPTPYREAVLHVKRRAEAALRGESAVALPSDGTAPPTGASPRQVAPDFVATNLLTRGSVQLRRLQGKPILLVFYTPTSQTVDELLRFAQSINDDYGGAVTVLGLAISPDDDRVRRQHGNLLLTFPILSGGGLRAAYAVDATPKILVLDADGVIRGSYTGWGPEIPTAVRTEIKQWLRTPGGRNQLIRD
jgi:peroxiredoxin